MVDYTVISYNTVNHNYPIFKIQPWSEIEDYWTKLALFMLLEVRQIPLC